MRPFDGGLVVTSGALVVCGAIFYAQHGARSSFQAGANLSQEGSDWAAYGGAPENTHYSALAQINRGNVKELEVAWSFDTGEQGGLETSPIIVDGILYG